MPIEWKQWKWGFLNCGEVGRALVYPLIGRAILNPNNIYVSETRECLPDFWENPRNPKVNSTLTPWEVAAMVDVMFLGFSMQSLTDNLNLTILPCLPNHNFQHKIIVSVIPGLTCDELAVIIAAYGIPRESLNVLRIVPNLYMCVGERIMFYATDVYLNSIWISPIIELLSYHGVIEEVHDSLIDILGTPSLCSPAYVYLIIEAITDGAVKNNLPRSVATKYVASIFSSAAKTVLRSLKYPGQLKDEACAPNSPAMNGIHELEAGSVRASLFKAVDAAIKKLAETQPHF